MMSGMVVLVDNQDRELGVMEKMDAHRTGSLHRAISVLVFNSAGELLLQQRAWSKYHGGGLWTNTCCSHPMPGEEPADAARRRLQEEMGLLADPVFSHTFLYRAEVGNGLWEHELDHVFTAVTDTPPDPDPSEAMAWQYISMEDLRSRIEARPEEFSVWLRLIVQDPAFRAVHVE